MKRTTKIAIALFAVVFAAGSMFAQDTYNLKFKFEKGKTYFYRTVSNVESTQNMMGTETQSTVNSKTKVRLEVTDVTPAQFEVIYSFDSLYTKQSSVQGDIENNGDAMVGKKTKYIYSNLGKQLKKIAVDEIKTGGMDMSGNNTNLFFQLTEKPLKVGETWVVDKVDTNIIGEDGKMITKSSIECKVEGKEKYEGAECLKITTKGTVKLEGAMTQGGYNIVMEGTGKLGGYFLYDTAKGLMTYTDSSTDMDMTAALPEQSVTIPITNKVKAKVYLLEK